jgi:hypothetical protein
MWHCVVWWISTSHLEELAPPYSELKKWGHKARLKQWQLCVEAHGITSQKHILTLITVRT